MIYAVRHDKHNVVKELVKLSNINHKDTWGSTALHYACDGGYAAIVETLLANGANINLPNRANETSLSLASRRGHTACISLLTGQENPPKNRRSN